MLQQPSSVPTNAEIEQATEAARNNVTVLEAESVRLDRVIGSQKREIIVLEGRKRDVEDQIPLVEGKLDILETQYASLEASFETLSVETEKKKVELTDRENAVTAAETKLKERESAVASREAKVTRDEADLQERNTAFESVRDHHFSTIDRIKQAITSL